jgi:serine/threonine protein kinase
MAVRRLKLKVTQDQSESLVFPPFVRIGDPFSLYPKIVQIGEGSSGVVVKVRLPNGLLKAVKIVNVGPYETREILKALSEAEIGMQMKHPHLLSIDEVWYDGTRFLFVMDIVEPLTVSSPSDLSKKSLQNKRKQIVQFQQLVSAVAHLYSMRILHRDIKVQNCGLDETRNLFLFDFGEACKTSDYYSQCPGTVLNMSPEVVNFSNFSDRSEIWALMSFLIEILTGTPMIFHFFDGPIGSVKTIHVQIKIDELKEPPIPAVFKTDESPAGILLLQILRRGLAIDPAERLTFPELEALLQELIALL